MNTQSLPELVHSAQDLLAKIRHHPQYQSLDFDCDITLGDVLQFFNSLQWELVPSDIDLEEREAFTQ